MAFTDTITSANSTGALTVPGVFPAPINLEGFSTDASVSLDAYKTSEPRMGVDGHLAAGYIPVPKILKMNFEANSPSQENLVVWNSAEEVAREKKTCELVFTIPSIKRRYTFVKGFLSNSSPMPAGKKTLDPTEWEITFEKVEVEEVA